MQGEIHIYEKLERPQKEGTWYKMNHKIEVNNETLYLKKSKIFGWGIVYPIKNEDGTMNWFNFITGGSMKKLIATIIMILIFSGVFYGLFSEYKGNMKTCEKAVNIVNEYQLWNSTDIEFNWSAFDLGGVINEEG